MLLIDIVDFFQTIMSDMKNLLAMFFSFQWQFAIVLLISMFKMPVAWAQAGVPFFCDATFYQTRVVGTGTRLLRYPTLSTAPVNLYGAPATLIPGAPTINGLGFNPRDNYLYAIATNSNTGSISLYRLGQTGIELVGDIPGVSNPFTATAGTFDKAGRYYFAGQGGSAGPYGNTISPNIIYRVDNVPASGTGVLSLARSYALSPSPVLNFGDFAFADTNEGINGVLYGASNQITPVSATGSELVRIQLNDAAATAVASTVPLTGENTAGTGSAFYDRPTNRFYMFSNVNNASYEIQNFASGVPISISTTAVLNPPLTDNTGTSDGTSCIFATVQAADIRLNKSVTPLTAVTVGQTVTFTIALSNAGPNPAQTVTVAEFLPAGLTLVSNTRTAGTFPNATSTWVVDGLPANTTQTLTLVATVNTLGTTTASYVNVASIAGSNQVGTSTLIALADPTPSNNTSSATVTAAREANLQITKTNAVSAPATLTAGQTTNYTITISLAAGATATDVANATLRDPAAPGLSCILGAAPICSATGGSVCPAEGVAAGELSIANLQGAGVLIPLLKPGATMSFRVSCGVTATGL
jgi:uncharacterized repeat protein (TIGR01451 family)